MTDNKIKFSLLYELESEYKRKVEKALADNDLNQALYNDEKLFIIREKIRNLELEVSSIVS